VIELKIDTLQQDKLWLLLRVSKSAMLSNVRPLPLYTPVNSHSVSNLAFISTVRDLI
jgi:hypothetical protein